MVRMLYYLVDIYIIINYFKLKSSHSSLCQYKTSNHSNYGKAIEYLSSYFVVCILVIFLPR